MRVAIAGGGIAGLACAIALGREKIAVELFERAPALAEIGAGIQLSPNAMAVLDRLGVAGDLKPFLTEPRAIEIRGATNGALLTSIPLGEYARKRYGSPYCVIHRGDLQAGLLAAVRRDASIALFLGAEVTSLRESQAGVDFHVGEGQRHADMLVAADGVHSNLRTAYFGYPGAASIGHVAWRAMLPMDEVPSSIARDVVGLWLGPGAHLVHYPVAAGAQLNVVIIAKGEASGNRPATAPFGSKASGLLNAIRTWAAWPLAAVDVGRPWVRGRAVLVGDAAHAMAPSVAQGGAQAIEDAWVLARSLARSQSRPHEALAAYERARRRRVESIVREAQRNLAIYDLAGLSAAARNMVLRLAPTALHSSRLDWIFRYKPE